MGSDPKSYGLSILSITSPASTPDSTVKGVTLQTPRITLGEPFRTPVLGSRGSLTPQSSSSEFSSSASSSTKPSLSPHDPGFHVNISTSSSLPLPPVDPSKRLSSSPNLLQQEEVPEKEDEEMDGLPLQTPPRLRPGFDPNQNHQQQHHHQQQMQMPQTTPGSNPAMASTPLRSGPGDFQTPAFQTPYNDPYWHLSPDSQQFAQGAASAPVQPQGRFFWNQSPIMPPGFVGNGMNEMPPTLHSNAMPQAPVWPSMNQPNMQFQNGMTQSSPSIASSQDSNFWGSTGASPFVDHQAQPQSFGQQTTGVNPNLIFSFANPPNTSPLASRQPVPSIEQRQPYEQQARESHREKEISKKMKSSKSTNRPVLSRSNTDSGFRKGGKTRSTDRGGLNVDHIPRKPSPLKRLSQASLTSIPESSSSRRSSRHRTRLVVDNSGTARTETYEDDRRSNSSLWDGEDSDEEEDVIINSARNSFVMPAEYAKPPAKLLRSDDDSDQLDRIERPLSSTSLSSASSNRASGLFRRSISLNMKNRLSQASFSDVDFDFSSQETVMEDVSEGRGDAQDALKQLVGGRLRQNNTDPNATIKIPRRSATNPLLPSAMTQNNLPSVDISQFSSPHPSSSNNTPITERSSSLPLAESTRCVCGTFEERAMVQCESCAKFSHIRCIFGAYAEQGTTELPRMWVCGFCTGQLRPPPQMGYAAADYGSYAGDASSVYAQSPLGNKGMQAPPGPAFI